MKHCVLLLVSILSACSSNEERDWEVATSRINGELSALRPTVRAINALALKEDPTSVRALVGICTSVDASLERIADTHLAFHALDREPSGPHAYMTAVPDNARWLVQHRRDMCRGDDWRCRDWCVKRWRALSESVDALRERAAKHGAHVESLTQ